MNKLAQWKCYDDINDTKVTVCVCGYIFILILCMLKNKLDSLVKLGIAYIGMSSLHGDDDLLLAPRPNKC